MVAKCKVSAWFQIESVYDPPSSRNQSKLQMYADRQPGHDPDSDQDNSVSFRPLSNVHFDHDMGHTGGSGLIAGSSSLDGTQETTAETARGYA